MKKILFIACSILILSFPARALFLLENDDCKRPGRSAVSFGQVAGGTAVNISWGIWESSNLYFIVGTGAGLGWKQQLIRENVYWPFSFELTAETVSLKNWHTSAYGATLRKKVLDDVSLFLKGEATDNNADWTGLEALRTHGILSLGLNWRFWRDTAVLLQISDQPVIFGTAAVQIIL